MGPDPTDTDPETVPEDVDVIDSDEGMLLQTPLVRLFGDSSRVRILAVLFTAERPLNPTEIVERAHLGTATWYNHRDDLLATGLVEKVADAGNSPLYAVIDAEDDKRVEWLEKLSDRTAAYLRSERRPSADA